ncbi:MAG: thrombospondin type 3 repeat-containing protein [Thermoleophilia bacterium]
MRKVLAGAALACTLTAATAASAAPAPVTGTVPAGHRLVALSYTGAVTAAARSKGRVTLIPPAKTFTLHLIGPKGRYAGPVVVGKGPKGTTVMGVRAGAKLGVIRKVKGVWVATPSTLSTDRSRTANARSGVPLGAKALGLVRSTPKGLSGPGRDLDRDGVPGAYDIDDDGDRILDNLDRNPGAASIAQLPGPVPGPGTVPGATAEPRIFSNLKLPMESSLNANAGVDRAQIDAALSGSSTLAIAVPAGDEVELDCGTLSYCSAGGTGTILGGGAFPSTVDADGDGFGTITRGTTGDFQLKPGATSAKIGSGDAFIWRTTTGGVETPIPGVLNYQFVTTPAVTSLQVNGGVTTGVTYPVAPSDPGTFGTPITVPAAGDVSVTFTLWRPQRAAISAAGETGDWVDIGGLNYSVDMPNGPGTPGTPGGPGPGLCPGATLTTTDPNLTVSGESLVDAAKDAVPDTANTITFTVNLTACATSKGGSSWDAGEDLKVDIQARTADGDNAAQMITFRRA